MCIRDSCNTENWGLGDFIRNGWKGLFGTFSYLDTPFSDVAAALKAEEKQKENGKGHYILIGLVVGIPLLMVCLLYTSDAADDLLCVDLGGRRIIKKKREKKKKKNTETKKNLLTNIIPHI